MRGLIQKAASFLPFVLALVLLSGCFEIEEKATFGKDGSGTYTLAFRYEKGSELYLEFAEQERTGTGEKMELFELLEKELRSVKGISHIKYFADTKKGVEGITFRFSNLEALNKAMELRNREKYFPDNYFALEGKTFRRSNKIRGFFPNAPEEEEIAEFKNDLEDEESCKFFKSLVYKSTFRFDRHIATCSGKNTTVSADKKEFSSVFTLLDLIKEGNILFENKVTFK